MMFISVMLTSLKRAYMNFLDSPVNMWNDKIILLDDFKER